MSSTRRRASGSARRSGSSPCARVPEPARSLRPRPRPHGAARADALRPLGRTARAHGARPADGRPGRHVPPGVRTRAAHRARLADKRAAATAPGPPLARQHRERDRPPPVPVRPTLRRRAPVPGPHEPGQGRAHGDRGSRAGPDHRCGSPPSAASPRSRRTSTARSLPTSVARSSTSARSRTRTSAGCCRRPTRCSCRSSGRSPSVS